ncbi:MAG: FIST N-terminal domain-containing protein [Mobilitalea sp.]
MQISQQTLKSPDSEIQAFAGNDGSHLLLVFAPREWLEQTDFLDKIRTAAPAGTKIAGCSTSGEITAKGAHDAAATLTFVTLENSEVEVIAQPSLGMEQSRDTGKKLAAAIEEKVGEPSFVLIFSDGLNVNGSELVAGLREGLAGRCQFSGGLAGDGFKFEKTAVIADGQLQPQAVVGVAFKGASLRSSCSSVAGWSPFGTFREVTRSQANHLDELDGKSAFEVYSSYLGADAANLPSSGLLYPLEIHLADGSAPLIRTLLAVDKESGRLTFAGDIPQGSTVRLMNASYDQLVDGAGQAARQAAEDLPAPSLALLVSCVGRKLALASYTDLEVDAVRDALPKSTVLTGFHSYGEIGLDENAHDVELHNQTMTVTLLSEAP